MVLEKWAVPSFSLHSLWTAENRTCPTMRSWLASGYFKEKSITDALCWYTVTYTVQTQHGGIMITTSVWGFWLFSSRFRLSQRTLLLFLSTIYCLNDCSVNIVFCSLCLLALRLMVTLRWQMAVSLKLQRSSLQMEQVRPLISKSWAPHEKKPNPLWVLDC